MLAETTRSLERAAVPYMITGSIASTYHGEPRSTLDIDIVIDPDAAALEWLIDELVVANFYTDHLLMPRHATDRSSTNPRIDDAAHQQAGLG